MLGTFQAKLSYQRYSTKCGPRTAFTLTFLGEDTVTDSLLLSKLFYSPTDTQVNCLKNNFKIYIKINIKTALTHFGAVTPLSGSTLLKLAKVTVVKIAN